MMTMKQQEKIKAIAAKLAREKQERSFPAMLHRMLTDIDELVKADPDMKFLEEVVGWQEHGKGFRVHNKAMFIDIAMPTWFSRIKYTSWIRQLSSHWFMKIHTTGGDSGAHYHQNFVRGEPDLASTIGTVKRTKTEARLHREKLGLVDGSDTNRTAIISAKKTMTKKYTKKEADSPEDATPCPYDNRTPEEPEVLEEKQERLLQQEKDSNGDHDPDSLLSLFQVSKPKHVASVHGARERLDQEYSKTNASAEQNIKDIDELTLSDFERLEEFCRHQRDSHDAMTYNEEFLLGPIPMHGELPW